MVNHPDLGYFDEGVDLTDADLYKSANQPFGQATILPPFTYQSKVFSDLEDEKLWTRSWVAIGTTHQLQNPGDLLPFTVGHHGIHVQRNKDGSLTGRFNKAQHGGCRAVPLQCQTGKKTKCSFTSCGYSLDRNVLRVEEIGENTPTMHQYLGLIPERLLPIKVDTWGPFVFVNLDASSNSLAKTLGDLPTKIDTYLSNTLSLLDNEWFQCTSNWKLAGRAFYDVENIETTTSNYRNDSENYFLTPDLILPQVDSYAKDMTNNAQLCWLFPNLLLILTSSHVVSVILQPTSMGESVLRTCIFSDNKNKNDIDNSKLPFTWQNYIQTIQIRASSIQEQADKLTAPGAPELKEEMIPRETNLAGYLLHRYVTKHIEAEHDYYWNAPLYNNP